MGQIEQIANPAHRQHIGFSKTHYQPLKQPYLKHLARKIQLFKHGQQAIGKVHLSVQTKTVEAVADINRYYQTRAKIPNHKNIVTLLQLEIMDNRGSNITQYLTQHGTLPHSSRNTQFDTVCSLNIFQTHCRRNPLEKNPIKGELRLYHEFYSQNLQKQSQRRRNTNQIYSEKQLWNIVESCIEAANVLGGLGLKEPLLSPLAIKLTTDGDIKVGEWQFTHYFQDADLGAEQNHFHQQGQTLLYHTEQNLCSTQPNQKQQFDILSCYYWPPQGTTSIQNSMNLGKLQTSRQSRGQVFSLGMTLLQLILERTLYQKQTFSEKQLTKYLEEATSYRLRQGYPLTHLFTNLLSKMLTWDSKQRITFQQIHRELRVSETSSTYQASSDRQSLQAKQSVSNGYRTVQKRGPLAKKVEGSGLIDPGEGDETHPTVETIDKNEITNRSRIQTSLDYHKLDYTIHRQRKEWQKFENRFMQSSYKLQPNIEIVKHSTHQQSFSAEIMLEDREDIPSQESLTQLQINNKETQVYDQEEERPVDHSNCISDSIKILDLSNIRANEEDTLKDAWVPSKELTHQTPSYNTKTVNFKKNTPKQMLEEDSLLLKSSKSPQIAKFSHQLHITSSVGSLHSQPLGRVNANHKDQDLFTSAELMALIKSSARRHEEKENSYHNVRLELSPSCVTSKVPVQMSQSTFVKEQFAKGWYEGGKLQGLRNGYGTFHYNEGGKYCGDWKQNLMHGRGTLYYSDGRIAYQGEWNCDKLNGNGILYNQNPAKLSTSFDYRNFDDAEEIWIYYEGGFANDDKCGKGVLQLSNGQRFQGTFRDDIIQGKGRFFPLDGTVVSGEWIKNRLVKIQSVLNSSELM